MLKKYISLFAALTFFYGTHLNSETSRQMLLDVGRTFSAQLYSNAEISQELIDTLNDTIVSGERNLTAGEMVNMMEAAREVISDLDKDFQERLEHMKWKIEIRGLKESPAVRDYFHTMRFFTPEDSVVLVRPELRENDKNLLEEINMYTREILLVIRVIDGKPKIIGFSAGL